DVADAVHPHLERQHQVLVSALHRVGRAEVLGAAELIGCRQPGFIHLTLQVGSVARPLPTGQQVEELLAGLLRGLHQCIHADRVVLERAVGLADLAAVHADHDQDQHHDQAAQSDRAPHADRLLVPAGGQSALGGTTTASRPSAGSRGTLALCCRGLYARLVDLVEERQKARSLRNQGGPALPEERPEGRRGKGLATWKAPLMSVSETPTARGSPPTAEAPARRRPGPSAPQELVLARYRLHRRLGSGAFGTVWMARDERLDRDVAVKAVPRERVMGGGFRREARAAARPSHPGSVTLYEAAVDDEGAYLVSELVDGATLAELLEAGRLSDRDIAQIGVALCDALSHAHAQGVIHRDVK